MQQQKSGAGRGHRVIVILLLLVILLLAAISCGLALRLWRRSDPVVVGSWRMQADLTLLARERANAWLRAAALGEQTDAGAYLPPIQVPVDLKLTEDGQWSRSVDAGKLQEAEREAQTALAEALRALVCLRIRDAGRPEEDAAGAEARIESAVGMSAEDYLAACGPALLPTVEELEALYGGSGGYTIEGPYLHLEGLGSRRYLADEVLLTLAGDDGTEVYRRVR